MCIMVLTSLMKLNACQVLLQINLVKLGRDMKRKQGSLYRMYLNYVNNFLSIAACADYYGITQSSMLRIHRYFKSVEQ